MGILSLPHFIAGINWGSERLNHIPEIIQLIGSQDGIHTQMYLTPDSEDIGPLK